MFFYWVLVCRINIVIFSGVQALMRVVIILKGRVINNDKHVRCGDKRPTRLSYFPKYPLFFSCPPVSLSWAATTTVPTLKMLMSCECTCNLFLRCSFVYDIAERAVAGTWLDQKVDFSWAAN